MLSWTRKKLEPTQEYRISTKVETMSHLGFELQIPSTHSSTPIMQLEVPPWAEGYDPTATGVDGKRDPASRDHVLIIRQSVNCRRIL